MIYRPTEQRAAQVSANLLTESTENNRMQHDSVDNLMNEVCKEPTGPQQYDSHFLKRSSRNAYL